MLKIRIPLRTVAIRQILRSLIKTGILTLKRIGREVPAIWQYFETVTGINQLTAA